MSIKPVLDTLNALHEAHLTLLELGEAKKQTIIDNNIEALLEILNQESNWTKVIDQLEEERKEGIRLYIRQFTQTNGLRFVRLVSISELFQVVFDINEKRQLRELHEKFMGTLEELKRINTLNQQLTAQALQFIHFSYDLIVGDPNEDVVYQHPAQQQAGVSARRLFDTKA